jgi:hypothetical protein
MPELPNAGQRGTEQEIYKRLFSESLKSVAAHSSCI